MKPVFFLIIFTLIVGCATYKSRPISASKTASEFEARNMDAQGLRDFMEENLQRQISTWPPKEWDLSMLTLAAFYYHPDLDVARARWEVAKAGVIAAGGRPNPTASFTPEYRSNVETDVSPWTLNFDLDIPVETAGKRGYRIAEASHLSEAARLDIATAAWRVRSRLRGSLLSLYAAVEREKLLNEQLSAQEEIAELLEQRLKFGDVSQVESAQAQSALINTRLAIEENQMQVAQDRAWVAEALGVPAQALDNVTISFGAFEQTPKNYQPDDIRCMALLGRPDIMAALAKYDASQSALQLEIAKQYPDIRLGPGYVWDQGENKWTLGLSIVLPVFNRNKGPIAEAEARRKTAAAEFIALQASALGEVYRALAGYTKAINEMETADVLLSTQKQIEKSSQIRFDSGESDRLTLISDRLKLYTAAMGRFETLVRAQEAAGALEDAVQRPLEQYAHFPSNIETNPRDEDRSVE